MRRVRVLGGRILLDGDLHGPVYKSAAFSTHVYGLKYKYRFTC